MTEISVTDLPEQPTAVVRATVKMDELRGFFDGVFGTVVAAVQAQGGRVAGPPFAMYHGMPGETIDVEAGFPVTGPFTGADEVAASSLPGGRTVRALHVGPYESLAETYQEVTGWMREKGLTPAASMWEVYMSDPNAEPDPATWRTELFWPASEGSPSEGPAS